MKYFYNLNNFGYFKIRKLSRYSRHSQTLIFDRLLSPRTLTLGRIISCYETNFLFPTRGFLDFLVANSNYSKPYSHSLTNKDFLASLDIKRFHQHIHLFYYFFDGNFSHFPTPLLVWWGHLISLLEKISRGKCGAIN